MTTSHPIAQKALILGVLATIAGTLGWIYSKNDNEEIADDIMDKAKNIAKQFKKTAGQVQETIKDIFGEINDELKKSYLSIQSEILTQIDELKEQGSLTKKKYDNAVEDIVNRYAKETKWGKDQINKLIKNFQANWEGSEP